MTPQQEREIRAQFEGAITEIGAGRVLVPSTPEERAYNNACERAMRIVESYIRGEGLFQM
jgi:hypothetical protein